MEQILDDVIDKIIEKASTGVQVMWVIVKGIYDKKKHIICCDENTEKKEDYTEYILSLIDTDTLNKVKIVVKVIEDDKYLIDIIDIKGASVGVLDDIEEAIKQTLYVLEHGVIEPVAE